MWRNAQAVADLRQFRQTGDETLVSSSYIVVGSVQAVRMLCIELLCAHLLLGLRG